MAAESGEQRSPHANEREVAQANSAMAKARAEGKVPKRTGETLRRAAQRKLIAHKHTAGKRLDKAINQGDDDVADAARKDIEHIDSLYPKVRKAAPDWDFIYELMPGDRPD